MQTVGKTLLENKPSPEERAFYELQQAVYHI